MIDRPADQVTSQVTTRPPFLLAIPVAALCLVWQFHVVLTAWNDPFGLPFDIALWIAGSVLKIVAFCATAVLLAKVLASISKSARRMIVTFALLAIAGSSLVTLAAATRERWAPQLSNDAIHYFSVNDDRSHLGMQKPWECWKENWLAGRVWRREVEIVLALAMVTAIIGFRFGHHRVPATFTIYAITFFLLVASEFTTSLHISDYDEFHGDIFASAALMDHLFFFVAIDPYTTLTSVAYLTLVATLFCIMYVNVRLDRRSIGDKTSPACDLVAKTTC